VEVADAVYVLHAFQKKSKKGIATPKQEIDLIRRRLAAARQHAKGGKLSRTRTKSSGNVYADLRVKNAEEHAIKRLFVHQIAAISRMSASPRKTPPSARHRAA
jgi:hypothetical protein